MLYFNLKPIFEVRQIEKPYSFLVKIGISPNTANKILAYDSHVMRLDNLNLICKALHCQPNDLLSFKQDPDSPVDKNHPLIKLLPIQEDNDWQKQLKTLPLDKLRKISQLLNQIDNEEQTE